MSKVYKPVIPKDPPPLEPDKTWPLEVVHLPDSLADPKEGESPWGDHEEN